MLQFPSSQHISKFFNVRNHHSYEPCQHSGYTFFLFLSWRQCLPSHLLERLTLSSMGQFLISWAGLCILFELMYSRTLQHLSNSSLFPFLLLSVYSVYCHSNHYHVYLLLQIKSRTRTSFHTSPFSY